MNYISKALLDHTPGDQITTTPGLRTEKDFQSVFNDFHAFEQQLAQFDEEVQLQL